MADAHVHDGAAVNTVLGPIAPENLGVVAAHEALLSVVPGAEYAYDITMDRAEIFDILAAKLAEFRAQGGSTVVDSTGMFHGRDLNLLEALATTTGVNIIASTGMGPEENLGGYFLTPQTNPPTPWPAEKFADLFSQEVTEGMVVPRLERRAAAGLVTTTADRTGMTPTEVSLFQGAARTALNTGIPVSIRFSTDAVAELELLTSEGLNAGRVLISGLDRVDAHTAGAAGKVAELGAYVGIDHVGQNADPDFIPDEQRVALVKSLIDAGHLERIILASNSIGVAKGLPPVDVPLGYVLTVFAPQLVAAGVSEADVQRILVDNPRDLLTVQTKKGSK